MKRMELLREMPADSYPPFPLTIWEQTEDFTETIKALNERADAAYKRLRSRGFTATYLSPVRVTPAGDLAVWLNDNMPLGLARRGLSAEQAFAYALRHGTCKWWDVKDLEEFAEGKGPIIEAAMWELGFRRSKREYTHLEPASASWAVRRKGEQEEGLHTTPESITDEKRAELEQRIAAPNAKFEFYKTFSVSGDEYGIFFQYNVNPFGGTSAERLQHHFRQMNIHGHIARKQDGFTMDATNIMLGNEPYVHIAAHRIDGIQVETVWPSIIAEDSYTPLGQSMTYKLAADLVRRVSIQVPKLLPTLD